MKRLFDPKEQTRNRARPTSVRPYHLTAELELAVNVALVCERPLLMMGASGTGKSSLARFVAWCLERDYAEHVITSRTSADDLKWRFDAVRRLQAAQTAGQLGGDTDRRFVTPGVLWDAFDPVSAQDIRNREPRAGRNADELSPNRERYGDNGAVVLLDEIDKADPDVPNDLLVTLDARWFHCTDLDVPVSAAAQRKILVLITSNQERELPRAFVRRCIVTTLPRHTPEERREIAALHREEVSPFLLDRIDEVFKRIENAAREASVPLPSTAEYLDAVNACLGLGISGGDPDAAAGPASTAEREAVLEAAVEATLWKHGPVPRSRAAVS